MLELESPLRLSVDDEGEPGAEFEGDGVLIPSVESDAEVATVATAGVVVEIAGAFIIVLAAAAVAAAAIDFLAASDKAADNAKAVVSVLAVMAGAATAGVEAEAVVMVVAAFSLSDPACC